MRKLAILVLVITAGYQLKGQSVGIGTTTPHTSAMLDVSSTSKGMLVPRMTSTQRITLTSPATGLLVFDTNTNSFWYFNGADWTNLATSLNSWSVNGNPGTNPATHFIGTNDNADLRFKINNLNAGLISNNGNLFLGFRSNNGNSTINPNTAIGSDALFSNTTEAGVTKVEYSEMLRLK